jgi:hypothetical protein
MLVMVSASPGGVDLTLAAAELELPALTVIVLSPVPPVTKPFESTVADPDDELQVKPVNCRV